MSARPYFRWFDAWIGCYVDRPKRRIYLQPLPCVGLRIDWGAHFPVGDAGEFLWDDGTLVGTEGHRPSEQ